MYLGSLGVGGTNKGKDALIKLFYASLNMKCDTRSICETAYLEKFMDGDSHTPSKAYRRPHARITKTPSTNDLNDRSFAAERDSKGGVVAGYARSSDGTCSEILADPYQRRGIGTATRKRAIPCSAIPGSKP